MNFIRRMLGIAPTSREGRSGLHPFSARSPPRRRQEKWLPAHGLRWPEVCRRQEGPGSVHRGALPRDDQRGAVLDRPERAGDDRAPHAPGGGGVRLRRCDTDRGSRRPRAVVRSEQGRGGARVPCSAPGQVRPTLVPGGSRRPRRAQRGFSLRCPVPPGRPWRHGWPARRRERRHVDSLGQRHGPVPRGRVSWPRRPHGHHEEWRRTASLRRIRALRLP